MRVPGADKVVDSYPQGEMEPVGRLEKFFRSRRGTIFGCLLSALSIAVLNRVGALFQVPAGVALVFPATAIAAMAGVLFRWWGVLAAFVGYQLLPWGLSTTLPRILFFATAASLEAAVPAAARLRPRGTTTERTTRLIVSAMVLNTLASSLIGVPGVVYLSDPPMTTSQIALAFGSWFLGDLITVVVLGLPLLVVLTPSLFMRPADIELFRSWTRRRGMLMLTGLLAIVIAVAMESLYRSWSVNLHWIAAFFVGPVLLSAAMGGIGGAFVANGAVGLVYLVQILRLAKPSPEDGMFTAVFSSYLNLGLFTVIAITTGFYAGRIRILVDGLHAHEKLLQESFEDVVTALAAAIEAKDKGTEGHVQRVAQTTVAIGKRLGIEGRRLILLRYAAILHDVGKIGIPEHVLNKRTLLTDMERSVVKRHVSVGVEILNGVRLLSPAIPFIRYHQERWDGDTKARYPGYFGLKGEEIPHEARIIAVVDAYDAMTNDRPYRTAMSSEEALEELQRESGTQFDPDVVQALIDVLQEASATPGESQTNLSQASQVASSGTPRA
ncbi:HD-GYP domain-containing protein [Candidatus Fermentibacteria bacterium]|nr:HD-GYP domain-containing protein [Candidatus Fermentibacteria bacterium]